MFFYISVQGVRLINTDKDYAITASTNSLVDILKQNKINIDLKDNEYQKVDLSKMFANTDILKNVDMSMLFKNIEVFKNKDVQQLIDSENLNLNQNNETLQEATRKVKEYIENYRNTERKDRK